MENIRYKNSKNSFLNFFKSFDIPRWIAFVGFFLFLSPLIFTINHFISYSAELIDESDPTVSILNGSEHIWFGLLDTFTYQSNFILLFFTFFFVFYPNHQFVKSNQFLLSCMVYITFTFIGYNVILTIPTNGKIAYQGSGMLLAGDISLHIICPIYFLTFGFLTMFYRKNQEPTNILKTFICGMIYPTIYVIYLASIPFVVAQFARIGDDGKPILGPDGKPLFETYSVYGYATNTRDYPLSWLFISLIYFVFFPGCFFGYYYAWKGFNKLNNRKSINN